MADLPISRYSPGPTAHDENPLWLMLAEIRADVSEIKGDVKEQNGRVRSNESAISRLQWAVYIGGPTLAVGIWYLIQMHMK